MKYFKHFQMVKGVKKTRYHQPEGGEVTSVSIPEDFDNMDYALMMEGVNADPPTNTIEEVDDT
tara:strand:- start:355 stop:543 length:189 start_codon:yes stop_codon:yes gene_type:complete